jgi:hypothetical protein
MANSDHRYPAFFVVSDAAECRQLADGPESSSAAMQTVWLECVVDALFATMAIIVGASKKEMR